MTPEMEVIGMVVRVTVAPAVLRWAVERAGWDEATTQKRAPKLDEWVAGSQQPTLKQVEKLAKETHTPFGFLFLSEPPLDEMPIPDLRTIGNAGVARPSADLLDTIYLCQSRQEWYRSYEQDNGAAGLEFVGSATTASPPTDIAQQMQNLLDFGVAQRSNFASWKEALRELIDRIEGLGVLVMVSGIVGTNTHRALNPAEFRGFALADPLAPLIFVNGADTKAAQIFTLLHELAHIWLGESALSNSDMTVAPKITEELWCNQVAAEVLLPLAALSTDYHGDASSAELERLAKKYRVSTLVVLKRVFDAGFLSWDDYRDRYETEYERIRGILSAQKDQAGGGNYYYTQPLRLSRQFAQAVIASALEGNTTYREAYQLLGTKKHSTFVNLAAELGVA